MELLGAAATALINFVRIRRSSTAAPGASAFAHLHLELPGLFRSFSFDRPSTRQPAGRRSAPAGGGLSRSLCRFARRADQAQQILDDHLCVVGTLAVFSEVPRASVDRLYDAAAASSRSRLIPY